MSTNLFSTRFIAPSSSSDGIELILVSDFHYNKHKQNIKTVHIKDQGIKKKIAINDIVMIVADSNYSTVYLSDGRRILTSKTLKVWSELLDETLRFVRPHRSYLVNSGHILGYRKHPRTMMISGDIEMTISRRFNIKQLVCLDALSPNLCWANFAWNNS